MEPAYSAALQCGSGRAARRGMRAKRVWLRGGRSGRCLGCGPEVVGAAADARATPFCPVGDGLTRPAEFRAAGSAASAVGALPPSPRPRPATLGLAWGVASEPTTSGSEVGVSGPSRRGRSCFVGHAGRPAAPLGVVNSNIHSENVYQFPVCRSRC